MSSEQSFPLSRSERGPPPPTPKDREHAALILGHIKRLRELGEFAGQDTRENEIHFIAMMLRNERLGLSE